MTTKEKTKPKRGSMPSHAKILEFWCSEKGKEILEKYNITPYGIHTLTIDAGEECWCCNGFCCPGYYDGYSVDKEKNDEDVWFEYRERSHIIAKSLGGSYECDNLFLMCGECHRRAPNTTDPKIFFEWVVKTNARVIHYKKELSKGLTEISKEIFPSKRPTELNLEEWSEKLHKFVSGFHSEEFSKHCRENMIRHGGVNLYNLDGLASELGLYKQYCQIGNK